METADALKHRSSLYQKAAKLCFDQVPEISLELYHFSVETEIKAFLVTRNAKYRRVHDLDTLLATEFVPTGARSRTTIKEIINRDGNLYVPLIAITSVWTTVDRYSFSFLTRKELYDGITDLKEFLKWIQQELIKY